MNGLLESVEMARRNSDPGTMIRGLAEVGKLLGHYAPIRQQVQITTAYQQRVICEMEAMTDEQLVALIEGPKH